MNTIERIEQIEPEDILNALWISFSRKWAVLFLKDGDGETSGWKGHATRGIFKDWANKWRPEWDRIDFAGAVLWLWKHETLKWYEETFALENNWKPKKEENLFKAKWNEMWEVTEEQKEYMMSRWINLSLLEWVVKNNSWKMCVPIVKHDWRICSLQSRNVWDKAYFLAPWWDSDWIFMNWINQEKKALIVVEGWSDYLTIRQWTTNVIGLVNAWNTEQLRIVKQFQRSGMEIFFIPDNDEAGEKAEEKMNELWIIFNTFRVGDYWVKDINELISSYDVWKTILKTIKEESEKPLTNIQIALQRLETNLSKGRVTISEKVIDKYCRWFRRGTTVLINGQSTWGKTSFSLHLLVHILKHTNETINYYSLETDIWEQILAIMWFYYNVSESELLANMDKYDINKFSDRLFIYDDIRTYKEMTEHITETSPWFFFLDFVQKLKIEGIRDEMEKATFYAQEMQNFLIDQGHTIWISLSQVAMSNYQAPLIQRTPKNAWALLESSDVVINVWKDIDWAFKVGFYKCKWWIWWGKVFNTDFNIDNKKYIIFDDWEFIEIKGERRKF